MNASRSAHDVELCRKLIARADEMRHQDPARALELARAGRNLAAGLDRARLGDAGWHGLQAEAWGVLASVLRAVSKLDEAEGALNVAIAFAGGVAATSRDDPTLAPRLAQRAAYLRASQQRYDEALELIEEAVTAFRELRAPAQLATCLVDRSVILADAGWKPQALIVLQRTLRRYRARMAPRTFLAAVHNIAVFLHDLARSRPAMQEAIAWLRFAIRCHERYPETLGLLKLYALHGLTAIRLGEIGPGVASLWAAHGGFKRLGARRQQAINLLDLAAVALQHERRRDLRRVGGEMFPVLRAFDHDPEARQALVRFCRALVDGTLTTRLIRRVATALRAGEPIYFGG